MPQQGRTVVRRADILWVCRHLASALQAGATMRAALDELVAQAPAKLETYTTAIRSHVQARGRLGEAFAAEGVPSYIWGVVKCGEARALPALGLAVAAELLESEAALPQVSDKAARSLALALGRIGVLLEIGAPIYLALEASTDELPSQAVAEGLQAACQAVKGGIELSDALVGADLPLSPEAAQMIAEASESGRLGKALPIVAEFVLEEAQDARPRKRNKEV